MHKKALKISLVILFVLFLLLCAAIFGGGWKVTVTPTGDSSMKLSYGDRWEDPGATAILSCRFGGNLQLDVTADDSQVDDSTLGECVVTYHAKFLWLEGEAQRTVSVIDDVPPLITLLEDPDGYTPIGEAYQEEGYAAVDNYDGNITDQVIRQEKDGKVYYSVTDFSGNKAEKVREIHYDDRTPPVITLLGDDPLVVEKGMEILDPGSSAEDDVDGNISANITTQITDDAIIYTVSDSHGNTATARRSLEFVDTQPPIIALSGNAEITLTQGDSYSEPGYTATDAGDGDLTGAVEVQNSVDTSTPGDYTVTYSVSDSAGNAASAVRTVHVAPAPKVPAGKVVYLTFDDGPGKYTQQLLDVLAKYNVKATFFVTNGSPKYQDMIAKEYQAGHSIGIHSYTHNYDLIYSSQDAFFTDLQQMQDVIVAQTGQATSLLRFPGGSSNTVSNITPGIMTQLTQEVRNRGYQYFDWNVASGDAGETTDTDTVVANVIAGLQKHDVSVVLQHDIKSFSVDAVEQIIQWGLDNGYTFLPLSYDSPPAHHHVNN